MKASLALVLVAACGFTYPGQPTNTTHPLADAGTGSDYPLGATVTLDGSGSYAPDGGPLTYHWYVKSAPPGSAAMPADAGAATTSFVPDVLGSYVVRLEVTDAAHHGDVSDVKIVAIGAITNVDAGAAATANWLDTVALSGAVTTLPGFSATYAWTIVDRPAGSTAALVDPTSLTPKFRPDAVGTFVIALDAAVGDEVREATVTVDVAGGGVSLGVTKSVAYAYLPELDKIVYAHDVGHAELVKVDPKTGAKVVVNAGSFVPRSLGAAPQGDEVVVGGPDRVVTVATSTFALLQSRTAGGCSAHRVAMSSAGTVLCFPVDGAIEPITRIYMGSGATDTKPCPAKSPDVSSVGTSNFFMVDATAPTIYEFDALATPLSLITQGTLTGIAPPVIMSSNDVALTGNGLVVSGNATLDLDLQTPVAVAAPGGLWVAVITPPEAGAQLKIFQTPTPTQWTLQWSAVVPAVNGETPTPKLVAYSTVSGPHWIIVAGTAAGDVAYVVTP